MRHVLLLPLILFSLFLFTGCNKGGQKDFKIVQEGSERILEKYTGSDQNVVIPEGVTVIGSEAFRGCTSLTSVEIPKDVTVIRSEAFQGCTSLTSVVIPENVTDIRSKAFEGCSSLTSIVIPEGVTIIGDWTFTGCSSLTSVEIPESVVVIGDLAFVGCKNLTIHAPAGSKAERYARKNDIPFKAK